MKLHHILACSALALSGLSLTSTSMASTNTATGVVPSYVATGTSITPEDGSFEVARRGRGGDGGRRPRVPGGSGCDDPRDIIEHPECRV
jgi:hypothetical protein